MAAVLSLPGCAEVELGAQMAKAVARQAEAPAATEARLAPDRFEATGVALWDGAATLQGVWFAHPLATRAQRVLVRAPETGREVEGALFKRDPALAGPSIIVSSDAARALGLTPGEPSELTITALDPTPPALAPTPVAEVETAALAAPPAEDAAEMAGPEESGIEEPVAEETEAPQVAFAATPDEPTEPEPTAPEPTAPEAAEPAADPLPAAEPSPRPSPRPAPAETAVVAAPAPETAAPAAARTRHLQVGSFAVPGNAEALTERLRARGAPARTARGGALTIVLIGPLPDEAAAAAAREAARAEGVTDALEVML
ncbi:MAG: SPOR domain-containing protein [Pikeienuella sp.]|uniref:SPOR domain-containing protein n=1 Tax=Pikeienuella sp. TaxID=2831957 RepID=UPI00391A55C9